MAHAIPPIPIGRAARHHRIRADPFCGQRAFHPPPDQAHDRRHAARVFGIIVKDRAIGRGRLGQESRRRLIRARAEGRKEFGRAIRAQKMRDIQFAGIGRAAQHGGQGIGIVAGQTGRHHRGGMGIAAQAQQRRALGRIGHRRPRIAQPQHIAMLLQRLQPGAVGELIKARRAGGAVAGRRVQPRFQPRLRRQIGEIHPRGARRTGNRGADIAAGHAIGRPAGGLDLVEVGRP